ncbi:PEP/pyruvate-binding domain-containing protein [Maridesulfovibrio ferrireducens]|uniref:PEP/pyruvate-binding domain-containing protein n=1 Tax=Maridesulfovibrio ferrireducens TaxID=246191 RepID=UPI001A25A54F|nr:PEP/pyruvate-binding domain-containing protein [Maridesulfovibrio ferrireducens]MBI9112798.1 pyruvate, phosphate dikinase [Maridesulfovibrio ferrireducens]
MKFRQLFNHWTYETFPPGRLLRRRYNSFKMLMDLEEECLFIISRIEDIGFGLSEVDWANIEKLSIDLGNKVQLMLEQLQSMNPVRFMDLMDYYNKINFYVRMAVTVPDPEIPVPFTIPLSESTTHATHAGANAVNLARIITETDIPVLDGIVIGSGVYNYFIEANDLRIHIDHILESVTTTETDQLQSTSEALISLFMKGQMPDVITNELEIAALETSKGGNLLTLSASVTPEDKTCVLPENSIKVQNIKPQDIVSAWKKAVLCKFSPESINARIKLGYSNRETPVAVIIQPEINTQDSGLIETMHNAEISLPPADQELGCSIILSKKDSAPFIFSRREKQRMLSHPEQQSLSLHSAKTIAASGYQIEEVLGEPQKCEWITDLRNQVLITSTEPYPNKGTRAVDRMKRTLQYIANLNISAKNTEMFLPEKSKSMYDLVRFANEKAVSEMFSLVSKEGLGLDGAKHLTARQPISLTVLNLEDGLFTTAAGKMEITPDDIKSSPMWALWFGLGSKRPGWSAENSVDGYAILSKTYLNIKLKSEKDLSEIDAVCDPEIEKNHIHFRFKGGEGTPDERIARIEFIKNILAPLGFEITNQGDLIEAVHKAATEPEIQKKLATIGHIVAHIAISNPVAQNSQQAIKEAVIFSAGLG